MNGRFIGLTYLSKKSLVAISKLSTKQKLGFNKYYLSELINFLKQKELSIKGIEDSENWVEINNLNKIANFFLGTKEKHYKD